MRITKKGQAKLLFGCLISTLTLSGLQAEPTLAPVAQVNLNEAPPPWAARPDAQITNYPNTIETNSADVDLNATMPLPAIPEYNPSEIAPLTLEGNNTTYQQEIALKDSNYQQAGVPQEQVKKKKTLMGKLFSRKKDKNQPASELNKTGIENWYQNRHNSSLAAVSASNFEAQAAQGDSDAQYQLGLMYRSGSGVEENVYQAIHWLTRAANAENSQAQYALAMIFRENATQAQDDQKAVSWYRRAAQNGHADAQYSLGLLYANGDSVQQDSGLAKKWFEKSAEQGNMAAKIAFTASEKTPTNDVLAKASTVEPLEIPTEITMRTPLEIPVAIEDAKITELTTPAQTHFSTTPSKPLPATQTTVKKQAVEEPQEQIRVASITAPTRPHQQAKKQIEETPRPVVQAPKQRVANSASPSGITKNTQHNTASNIDTASIRQNAMAGDAENQLLYGSLYEDGKGGLEQNYKEAAFWYQKAADQGYAKAQYNLGLLYEDGKGMSQDYYEASQWYKRASNNGFSEAQNNLGVLYIMGKGVIKDINRAELMFRRASEQGNANAERNLKMLLRENSE